MLGALLQFELRSVLKQPRRWAPPMVALVLGWVTLFFDSEGKLSRILMGPHLFAMLGVALWLPLTHKADEAYLLARPTSRMQVFMVRCCIFGIIGALPLASAALFGMLGPEHVKKPALVIEGFENVQKLAKAGYSILFQDDAERSAYLSWLAQPVRGQGQQARVEGLALSEFLGGATGFCTYMLLMLGSIRPMSSAGQASGSSWSVPVDLICLTIFLLWLWIALWETSLLVTLLYLHTLPVAGAVVAAVVAFGAQAAWRWRHTSI